MTFVKESEIADIAAKLISLSNEVKKKRDISVEKENTYLPLPKSSTKASPNSRAPFRQS
jgi:hypothetical protein